MVVMATAPAEANTSTQASSQAAASRFTVSEPIVGRPGSCCWKSRLPSVNSSQDVIRDQDRGAASVTPEPIQLTTNTDHHSLITVLVT